LTECTFTGFSLVIFAIINLNLSKKKKKKKKKEKEKLKSLLYLASFSVVCSAMLPSEG